MERGNLTTGTSRMVCSLVGASGGSAHCGERLMVVQNVTLKLAASEGQRQGAGAHLAISGN